MTFDIIACIRFDQVISTFGISVSKHTYTLKHTWKIKFKFKFHIENRTKLSFNTSLWHNEIQANDKTFYKQNAIESEKAGRYQFNEGPILKF